VTQTHVRSDLPVAGVEASQVAEGLGVDPARGLSIDEARSRLQSHGANKLTAAKKESGLQAFLRQYRDFMQIILLVAAVVNLVVTGDLYTSSVLFGRTVLDGVIVFLQEIKPEQSG